MRPPRWRRQARTLHQGTTGVRRSLPPRGAAPAGASRCPPRTRCTSPGIRLRPPSSLTCAHPALPGAPAVSTSPPAPPTSSKCPSPRLRSASESEVALAARLSRPSPGATSEGRPGETGGGGQVTSFPRAPLPGRRPLPPPPGPDAPAPRPAPLSESVLGRGFPVS